MRCSREDATQSSHKSPIEFHKSPIESKEYLKKRAPTVSVQKKIIVLSTIRTTSSKLSIDNARSREGTAPHMELNLRPSHTDFRFEDAINESGPHCHVDVNSFPFKFLNNFPTAR